MLWETTNVWKDGMRLHHDHATHKIEGYSWAKIFFYSNILNNHGASLVKLFFLIHCFSISCSQWPLSISMLHAIICSCITLFMLHAIICSCITLSVVYIVLVVSPWYSCKQWILVEEDSLNRPFEFNFDEELLDIGS